ncbi:MAG: AraC family transcriptional regulator [Pseudomonadota bacterium]
MVARLSFFATGVVMGRKCAQWERLSEMTVQQSIEPLANVTEIALNKYEEMPIKVDAIARSTKQSVAAIKSTEQYLELTYGYWPAYAVVLPTRMPDPVRKLGGELHRGKCIRVGEFGVVAPGRPSHWATSKGGVFETIKLVFPDQLVQETAERAFGATSERVELLDLHNGVDPLILQLMRQIGQELTSDDGLSDLYLESATQLVVQHLLRHHSTLTRPREQVGPKLTRRSLDRALEYIEANLGEDVSLTAIASAACVSPHHFLRAFKEAMGDTPHRYVVFRRVELCRELLTTTDQPISEIAYTCGFSSQAHMTTTFRRSTGTTPATYRRSFGA